MLCNFERFVCAFFSYDTLGFQTFPTPTHVRQERKRVVSIFNRTTHIVCKISVFIPIIYNVHCIVLVFVRFPCTLRQRWARGPNTIVKTPFFCISFMGFIFENRGRYTADPGIVYVSVPMVVLGTGCFRCFLVAAPTADAFRVLGRPTLPRPGLSYRPLRCSLNGFTTSVH